MSGYDPCYVNPNAAQTNAPTTDGGADDPNGQTLQDARLGAIDVNDKFTAGAGAATDLVIYAAGGAATDVSVYVFFRGIGWVMHKKTTAPDVGAPVRVPVPAYGRIFIRVVNKGAATAIYAAFDVGV